MFSFTRLRGADPTLGVEMSSTGEVACFGADVQEAFLQALLATTFKLPTKDPNKYILVSIAEDKMRHEFVESVQQLVEMGFQLAGTPGTAEYYSKVTLSVAHLHSIVLHFSNRSNSHSSEYRFAASTNQLTRVLTSCHQMV